MSRLLKNRIVQTLLVSLVLPGVSGCATIISGRTQRVRFTSEPAGATVTVGDKEAITPATLKLRRSEYHVAQISKDGYHTAEVVLRQEANNVVLVNVALFALAMVPGLIGMIVDGSTGAAARLDPGKPHVNLTPRQAGEPLRVESTN